MRVSLYVKLLPLYLGLAVLIASPIYFSHQHNLKVRAEAVAAQKRLSKPKPIARLSGQPVRIIMPELSIDVPVVDGYYMPAEKIWYVAPRAATYATATYPINNSYGASFIYGHWFDYVFGKTRDIKPGYTALVYTDNGHIFKYVFTSETTVIPSDTQLFASLAGKPGLRVMTCGGTWAQNRRIMSFNLVQAS